MDAFLAAHLKGVSRTYAILIPLLPRRLRGPVGLAYLLMRIVDTLEDAPGLSTRQRSDLLAALETALTSGSLDQRLTRPLGETEAERRLMRALPRVLARLQRAEPAYRDAITACGRSMIAGLRRLLARSARRGVPYPAIRDAAELHEYCHYVAGVVGAMLCRMIAHYLRRPALERLRAVAVELGIGLQLVNILKDAVKDSRQGRRYLPLAANGQIAHAEVYRAVLGEARLSLRRGVEFVLALPPTAAALRSFCGLPIAWGAMTLARAERDAAGAKIGRGTIRSSIARFKKLAGDDQALRRWLASMLRAPGTIPGSALPNPA